MSRYEIAARSVLAGQAVRCLRKVTHHGQQAAHWARAGGGSVSTVHELKPLTPGNAVPLGRPWKSLVYVSWSFTWLDLTTIFQFVSPTFVKRPLTSPKAPESPPVRSPHDGDPKSTTMADFLISRVPPHPDLAPTVLKPGRTQGSQPH